MNIVQVDTSEDLQIPKTSEEELFEYVESLKEMMAGLSTTLIDTMHKSMKQFGNTLKTTKKDSNKAIKEVSKTYKESNKKAEKIKANCKDSAFDDKTIMAIEKSQADYSVYKFYLDFSGKKFHKETLNVYKECHNILTKRPVLKVSKKIKDRDRVVEVKPKRVPKSKGSLPNVNQVTLADETEDEKEAEATALKKLRSEHAKEVRFLLNPNYDGNSAPTPNDCKLLYFVQF